jgi:DNA-binding transcriptional MocR family regulator
VQRQPAQASSVRSVGCHAARYVRLAFSSAAEDEMEEGVRRLATLL